MNDEQGSAPSIEVRGLTRRFGNLVAVDGVDLTVARGEFFGLLGHNGAGKSTMIKMMTGLLAPTSGTVRVLGVDMAEDPVVAKRSFGLLPEGSALFERLTGREFVSFAGRMYGVEESEVRVRCEELFDLLELEDRDRLVADYSTGMKRKVGLAAALIHAPRILFLDEPFNGMDVITTRVVRELLARLVQRGVTIMFCSHILEIVEKLCTRLAILKKGRIVAQGTLEELRHGTGAEGGLEELFLHYTGSREGSGRSELTWLS